MKKIKENKDKDSIQQEQPINQKRSNNRIYLIIFTIIILALVFAGSYYLFANMNKVEYNGLTFTKEFFGELPVFHHYYYITPQLKYNLYLRNDPRKNIVPITGMAVAQGIGFTQANNVYISLEPDALVGCEYGSVGISTLSSFLTDNQLNVKGASTDEDIARENKIKYATCEFRPFDDVIIIRNGEETKITIENQNCYIIEVANCEIVEAVEKFQVQAILDAQKNRESS